jgi:hypothetical protein
MLVVYNPFANHFEVRDNVMSFSLYNDYERFKFSRDIDIKLNCTDQPNFMDQHCEKYNCSNSEVIRRKVFLISYVGFDRDEDHEFRQLMKIEYSALASMAKLLDIEINTATNIKHRIKGKQFKDDTSNLKTLYAYFYPKDTKREKNIDSIISEITRISMENITLNVENSDLKDKNLILEAEVETLKCELMKKDEQIKKLSALKDSIMAIMESLIC